MIKSDWLRSLDLCSLIMLDTQVEKRPINDQTSGPCPWSKNNKIEIVQQSINQIIELYSRVHTLPQTLVTRSYIYLATPHHFYMISSWFNVAATHRLPRLGSQTWCTAWSICFTNFVPLLPPSTEPCTHMEYLSQPKQAKTEKPWPNNSS